jgi:subtilisin
MNARSSQLRGSDNPSRGGARKGIRVRPRQYMIAPTAPGVGDSAVIRRLEDAGGEVVRTLNPERASGPPVVVARMTPEKLAALLHAAGGMLVVEVDEPLRCATAFSAAIHGPAVTTALGSEFTTTIQVLSESDAPLEGAEVQLVGEQWRAQGFTASDGKVDLTLCGEVPDTLMELIVRPRVDHWGLWKSEPELQPNAVNVVAMRPLSEARDPGWGGRALQLDRLPPEYRGGGVKIGLIDTGIATSHKQLGGITQGFATAPAQANGPSWSQDPMGHGTACAGIISAAWDPPRLQAPMPRGYASKAELHACKLPTDARSSDLVAALDHCVAIGVDLVCVGFGCRHGSTIVEQRIVAAKQRGIAIIAAAGSDGGPVQFPASSPHVLAVAAIGLAGTFPDDSPHAAHAASAVAFRGGFFVPAFSCRGPELDLCAPGLAVTTCQSPDGYVACDGSSPAASHVAALAALVLAHHIDFRGEFAARDARRVERLFQILKETAQPLGNPMLTGTGLPCAPLALGLQLWAPQTSFGVGLGDMRDALDYAGLFGPKRPNVPGPQPQRGPAFVAPLPLTTLLSRQASLSDLKAAMQLAGLSARA